MSLKLGVIGAGAIGKEHIRRCTQVLQGAIVVAVSDINADNARAAVALPGVQAEVYADGHDVINASDVDAILVTSWDPTHEEYTLAAIAAGKPVFCEKPLAMSAEGCRRIVDAEMKAGRRLVQVGFMRPYDEGYLALKKVIDDGDIGAPLMLRCAHRNQSVGENYTTDMAITNTLIHELDVLRWLLNDDYRSVQVRFPRSTSHTHARLKDPQIVSFETKKGTLIDVEVFVNCQYGYDIQCEVVGETGIARLPEPSAVQMRKSASLSTAILTDWKDRFIKAYDVELQAFINDVKAGQLHGPSAWDGYAASVAADACIKAQGTSEPVEVGCDLMIGSMIKNVGGGIARTGGYIAGKEELVQQCAERLTCIGMGKEVGCTLDVNRELYLGFFHAPDTTANALKTADFAASLFGGFGFSCHPPVGTTRGDIVEAICLGDEAHLTAFCQGIQQGSPVDSFVIPEAWDMPGYTSKVIMAAGAFTMGASIELSADAPIREPFAVWMQGGMTYTTGKIGVLLAAQKMLEQGLLSL